MALTPEYNLRSEYQKNWLINGDMAISQRASSFAAVTNGAYTLDRFNYYLVGATQHTISQDTDVPTTAQAGYAFRNSLRANLTTPDTAIAATDIVSINQKIEGYNYAKFANKIFTLSFWVKATLPGTYCVGFQNSANNRSYVAEYTINASDTWEYKTITVLAPPVSGTWNYTNGVGLEINWTLAAGSNFQQTAGSWQTNASAKYASANQVNGVDTGATNFRLTGVKLNLGPVASPFSLFGADIEGELAACQRYYEKSYNLADAVGSNVGYYGHNYRNLGSSGDLRLTVYYKQRKRSGASMQYWNLAGASNQWNGFTVTTDASVEQSVVIVGSSVTNLAYIFGHWAATAEL